ncbi:MAG TPA: hypothetical protein VFD48_13230, partial [Pyrinomonadaceae bacterium]|nr:hypothetical protein [Pyrinomonadaceae bacterium]
MKDRVAFVFRVAFSLVTTATLMVAVVFAQGTKQGASKGKGKTGSRTTAKPTPETLKICQGVPIPAGYVVTAFLTSSTCPHGLYILKKQDPYSESLGISKRGSAEPRSTPASPPKAARTSAPMPQPAGTSASVRRPRRVGTAEESGDAPVLHGGPIGSPARPPTLTSANALGSRVNASSDPDSTPDSTPGPEEVSEGDVVRVDTNLVTVPVSVLDRHGRFIPNLSRED